MKISDFLGMLGGLALFLYGMQMMSESLEDIAGEKLEYILKKLTDQKIKAIFVGTIVTCLIQSSSALTILLIGFVNARVMSLQNAIWVVMGANIGTTITGQMIALDIGLLAPVFAMIGVLLMLFIKHKFLRTCGEITAGLGILFMGLEIMSQSMAPLQQSQFFLEMMTSLSHPLLSVLFGMLLTALIQSSSASIGILQMLASQQLIPFSQAVYFIFGFDIGTCMTAFLASLSGCLNAKRLALFHVFLNVFGTCLFLGLCTWTPIINIVAGFTPESPMRQIANMHTFFNIVTTLGVYMIDSYLFNAVYYILPDKQ